MKILLTGASGQLGTLLQAQVPADMQLVALSSQQLDIGDAARVQAVIAQLAPDVVINAAAYTQVDKAEAEPQLAYRVNQQGVDNLIAATPKTTRLLHISTDFVFDGHAHTPYLTTARPNPLSVYGNSKLAGEQALLQHAPDRSCIVRTAWLYSAGSKNFMHTMLHLMRTRDSLRVVDDQRGTPTSAQGLADAIWQAVRKPALHGVLHWTDAGETSWYGFACEIQRLAVQHGLLQRAVPITPVSTAEFPTPATRPPYSVLDKSTSYARLGLTAPRWQDALAQVMQQLALQNAQQETPQQETPQEAQQTEKGRNATP